MKKKNKRPSSQIGAIFRRVEDRLTDIDKFDHEIEGARDGKSLAEAHLPQTTAFPVERSSSQSTDERNDEPHFLAEIGTGLWRLKQKMVQPGTDLPQEGMERAYRHFETVWDILRQRGVEVQDHTGDRYDAGMSINVLASQPMADLKREKIIDTLRPTIYYHKKLLQMGEVIVGVPDKPQGD